MTYSIILADPPWRYRGCPAPNRRVERFYPTMSEKELSRLDVASIAATHCTLFLWATSPKLDVAMRLIRIWGFKYKTCGVWVKERIGMGFHFRQRHELLLVATKGKPGVPLPADRRDSVFTFPRGRHSAKPVAVHEAIERAYPHRSKLELFAREPRAGWDVWGNEIANDVLLSPASLAL